jgi:hypothetical protein
VLCDDGLDAGRAVSIFLSGSTDILQLTTGGSQSIDMYVSYIDDASGSFTGGLAHGNVASISTVTLLGSPATSTIRNVKFLSLSNKDASTSCQVTLVESPDNGTTKYQLGPSFALGPGQCWTHNDLEGFVLIDAAGGRVETPLSGRFLKRSYLTSGTSGNFLPSTNTVFIRGVAGGGGGGGVSSGSANGAAGGGGAGSYLEKTFSIVASAGTGYTFTVGGGGTGASGAAGNNGTNSTFVYNSVTYTCNGGTGGPLDTSSAGLQGKLGGAGGTVSTNGDLNATGDNGQAGNVDLTAAGISGNGGSSPFGGGGLGIAASGTGNNGGGYGAGGSGGLSTTSGARTGGNGTGGLWIVEEYS